MQHTYEGWGFVLPIAEVGEEEIVRVVSDAYLEELCDMNDVDNSMLFGTYESFDNIDSAVFAGEEVDTSEGIVIFDFSEESPERDKMIEISEMLEEMGAIENADDPIVGRYEVVCQQ